MMGLGQTMYGGPAGPSGAGSSDNGHGEPRGEDVVEGEYQKM